MSSFDKKSGWRGGPPFQKWRETCERFGFQDFALDFVALLNPQSTQVSLTNGKSPDGTVQVSVAANETVDSTDNAQQTHIMIIQDDNGDTEDGNTYTTQIISREVSSSLYSWYYIVSFVMKT